MTQREYDSLRVYVEGRTFPIDYNATEISTIMKSLLEKYPEIRLPTIEKN